MIARQNLIAKIILWLAVFNLAIVAIFAFFGPSSYRENFIGGMQILTVAVITAPLIVMCVLMFAVVGYIIYDYARAFYLSRKYGGKLNDYREDGDL